MTGDGRFVVARHWRGWAVLDGSWNPPRVVRRFESEALAEAAAVRLNGLQAPAVQGLLFDGGS